MTNDGDTTEGRTNSAVFNRFIPLVYTLILWSLCRLLVDGEGVPYVLGLMDGAFSLLTIRTAAVVLREIRKEDAELRLEVRKGLVIGTLVALGCLVVMAFLGVTLRL